VNAGQSGGHLGYAELLAAALAGFDPTTLKEAPASLESDNWQEAMDYEIGAKHKNNTWELVNLTPGHCAVRSNGSISLKQMVLITLEWRPRDSLRSLVFIMMNPSPLLPILNCCVCFWCWLCWRTDTSTRSVSSLHF
jgi:hypothetical protein